MDICINRHGGNTHSEIANNTVLKEKDRQVIYDLIVKNKTLTSKEAARMMNKQLNQISGRFTELKASEIIEETGETREGCAVYRISSDQLTLGV